MLPISVCYKGCSVVYLVFTCRTITLPIQQNYLCKYKVPNFTVGYLDIKHLG